MHMVRHTQPDVTQDTGERKDPKSSAVRTIHLDSPAFWKTANQKGVGWVGRN